MMIDSTSTNEKYHDEDEIEVSAYKPLGRYRPISIITIVLLFIAFLFFLLVSLSMPIIKTIYLLDLKSTTPVASEPLSLATELRFGVWGFCATSNLHPPTPRNAGLCFGPQLGYTIPPGIASAINLPPAVLTVISRAIIFILVLHPICAGLSFLCLLPSLFLTSHRFSIFVLILTIILALLSTTAFAIDLALVLVAKANIGNIDGRQLQFAVGWGNGVWLILTAVVVTWVAVVALSARACYCLGQRRPHHERQRRRHRHRSIDPPEQELHVHYEPTS